MALIGEMRDKSARIINDKRDSITELEDKNRTLHSCYNFYQTLQTSLNILGLVIVLLKDLPVWKSPV